MNVAARTIARSAVACLLAAAGTAGAAAFRIDDSGSSVSEPVASMRWRQLVPGRGADHTVEAALRLDVRLDLRPWLNQRSRIYLVLDPARETPVLARWTTQGRLLPGVVVSGGRALLFEGPAGPSVLAESLLMTLEADGRQLSQAQSLQFHFEIEPLP